MNQPKLLPEGSCLLHIGPYKTGSTAIQSAMHNARDRLGDHGVLYAGRGTRDRRAGWAVMDREPRGRDTPKIEEWYALVDEVHQGQAADLRVCVSNEDFARMGPKYARRIADDLGRERLHVVAVARRFDRLLPSQWQERVKCHETLTYDEFLRVVLDEGSTHRVHKAFWASHGVEGMAERWGSLVGADSFTVVVSDDSDRSLLLRTFEVMLGLPDGFLELDDKSNPSLPANGVEFVRRLNEAFDADPELTDAAYFHLIQRGAIRHMKYAPRSDADERIPPLPAWAADRVAELSRERVATLEHLGVNVVGDPAALLTDVAADRPERLPEPPDEISLGLAVKAVEGVVDAVLAQRQSIHEHAEAAAEKARAAAKAARKAQAAERAKRPAGRPLDDQTSAELLREAAGRLGRRVRPSRG